MDSFRIKIHEFEAADMSCFEEVRTVSSTTDARSKCDRTSNAYRARMAKQGIYVPKFSISHTHFGKPEAFLQLEFSAGKLIYGTNLKEVAEKDFQEVVANLLESLKSVHVNVTRSSIENAVTILAAYARNIPVGQFGSVREIMRVIAPFNYRPRSTFNATMREGNGTSELKYFNDNSHITLYDKLGEIAENPVTTEERKIAECIKNGHESRPLSDLVKETLRIELTLHNKTAVRQALSGFYGNRLSFTFAEAFRDRVRDTLLRGEIDKIYNHPLQKIVLLTLCDRDVFNEVINKYCHTIAQKREMRVALDILYARGLSAYREDVLSKATERTWFRYQKRLKQISNNIRLPEGAATNVNNVDFLEYLLSQFGIEPNLRPSEQLGLF